MRLQNKESRWTPQGYGSWEETAKGVIEEEMSNRGIRYKQLSRLLEPMGIHESPDQLNRKVNRKRFSAAFLFACLCAMDVKTIEVADLIWGQNK